MSKSAGDYIRRIAAQQAQLAFKKMLREKNLSTNHLPQGQIGCLNADRTKVKFDNGKEFDVTVIGNPTQCCFVQEISPGKYLAMGPKPQFISIDGGKAKGYAILYAQDLNFTNTRIIFKDIDKPELYTLDPYAICGVPPGPYSGAANIIYVARTHLYYLTGGQSNDSAKGLTVLVVFGQDQYLGSDGIPQETIRWGLISQIVLNKETLTAEGVLIDSGTYVFQSSQITAGPTMPSAPGFITSVIEPIACGIRSVSFSAEPDPDAYACNLMNTNGEHIDVNFFPDDVMLSFDDNKNVVIDVIGPFQIDALHYSVFRVDSLVDFDANTCDPIGGGFAYGPVSETCTRIVSGPAGYPPEDISAFAQTIPQTTGTPESLTTSNFSVGGYGAYNSNYRGGLWTIENINSPSPIINSSHRSETIIETTISTAGGGTQAVYDRQVTTNTGSDVFFLEGFKKSSSSRASIAFPSSGGDQYMRPDYTTLFQTTLPDDIIGFSDQLLYVFDDVSLFDGMFRIKAIDSYTFLATTAAFSSSLNSDIKIQRYTVSPPDPPRAGPKVEGTSIPVPNSNLFDADDYTFKPS